MKSNASTIGVAAVVVIAGVAYFALDSGIPIPGTSSRFILSIAPAVSPPPTPAGVSLAPPPPIAGPGPSRAIADEKSSPWKTDWQRQLAQPASPERDAKLADALVQLQATSPDDATRQFLALDPVDRVSIAAITLARAADRSTDETVRAAIRFCDEDPAYALEHGRSLISALEKKGDYPAALSFVLAEDSIDGWLGENAHKWLTVLFTDWAATAPRQALQVAQESIGANYRGEALQVVSAAWAKTDPAEAAQAVSQLPSSPDRDRALDFIQREWSDRNPAAATAWFAGKPTPAPR